ncbi:hypothetical protein [Alteromonas sp. ASW11-130]|uniref:hypothetical protein n=1 Tax=Alteromonas sp. ASW11-130 TaxID=3015775 RepID=UPI0022427016|nr:hypothetical protein [Alteromonas sp. ASW11-130]MCW8090977.1 hypothetical protein [Alteromonas sp. ASW11-130]
MERIEVVSKVTKWIILLGLILHTVIFFYFGYINLNSTLFDTSLFAEKLNLFAVTENWSYYADQLKQHSINSFWVLGTVDFAAQFFIAFFLFKLFALYENG